MTTASIYELLLALGRSVCNDSERTAGANSPSTTSFPAARNTDTSTTTTPSAQQLLRQVYAVLLQGPPAAQPGDVAAAADIVEELHFVQFEMALTDPQRSARLGTSIAQLCPSQQHIGTTERDVLRLLLQLRGSVQPTVPASGQKAIFGELSYRPVDSSAPGGAHRMPLNCYTNVMHQYLNRQPDGAGRTMLQASPSFFDMRRQLQLQATGGDEAQKSNPYVSQPLRVHRRCTNQTGAITLPTPKHITQLPAIEPVVRPPVRAKSADIIHLKGYSWDYVNVPLDRHRPEPQFASESEGSLPHILHMIGGSAARSMADARILSTEALVADLKRLLVGTASESFGFDETSVRFVVTDGLCVRNGTVATTVAMCADFMECGTCCARLRLMCDRDADYGHKLQGFVFRTVCLAVEDFLGVFHKFVEDFNDVSVLQLANRMSPLMRQIRQLANMFAIHPDMSAVELAAAPLPHGSAFLSYLHGEITNHTQPDVAHLFTYILQQCCRVYYRHLELWLFHGRIEDASAELFIEFNQIQGARSNSKLFWDKAFRVRNTSANGGGAVPDFLLGTESATLLCGKYTMLLMAIRPEHPLLRERPPRLTVCLSDGELVRLRAECTAYAQRVRRVCGQPVAVRDEFARQAALRRECVRRATERFAENMQRWREEQQLKVGLVREEQARNRAILERQMSELHERKVEERRENLRLDREVLRQSEEVEALRQGRERAERERRLDYYAELGELVERQRTEADAVVTDLREQLAEAKSLTAQMETCLVTGADRVEVTDGVDSNQNPVAALEVGATTPDANANPSHIECDDSAKKAVSNKAMVLGSTFDFHHHSTAGTKATQLLRDAEPLRTDYNSNPWPIVAVADASSNQAHLEMLQNRARIMGQEYDLIGFTTESQVPVTTANVGESELTDLQRNRRKVMSEEFGHAHQIPSTTAKLQLQLNVPASTAAQRPTPMSTSSDTPHKRIEDSIQPLKLDVNRSHVAPSSAEQTSEMQTAATSQPCGRFRFDSGSGTSSMSVSVYESARSGAQTAVEDEPAEELSESNLKATESRRFEYPTSLNAIAKPSKLFALPARTAVASSINIHADGLDDESFSDSTVITGRLRTSYLLPLQTHLSVLSNEILKVFLLDLHALDHFKSLRNYFCMMDGEFASHICDGLFGKLEPLDPAAVPQRPVDILNFACLHALLDGALGSSIIGNDPHAERLSFIVDDIPEAFDVASPHVLHMLNLTYAIEWPLNLLLSPDAIAHYARIFQHLLALRRCRYVLDGASQLMKSVGRRRAQRSPQLVRVQQVRNKLLQFVNALQNHVTATALQASWRRFKGELVAAESMEDCYQMHVRYLKQVEFLCMLNRSSGQFYKALESVMVLVLRFYHKLKRHEWQFDEAAGVYTHASFERLVAIEADFDRIVPYLIHMGEKISRRGYQTEISDLISLINFNGYYDAGLKRK